MSSKRLSEARLVYTSTTDAIAADLRLDSPVAINRPRTKKHQPRLTTGETYPVTVTNATERALSTIESILGPVTIVSES
jgi:hypothetical protein